MSIFIKNKYRRIYCQIVSNAKSSNRVKLSHDDPDYIYYENHHLIPRSLGGQDKNSNLVLLTGREHFLCHWLLTKFCHSTQHTKKMQKAFWSMARKSKKHKRQISSAKYEIAKRELSKSLLGHEHFGPFVQSKESNDKRRNKLKGKPKSPMKESTKQILREQRLGKPLNHTPEHREYLAKKAAELGRRDKSGDKNPFYGKKHSAETIAKLKRPKSEEHKEKLRGPKSDEHIAKMKEAFKNRPLPKKTLCCGKWYDPGNLSKHRKSLKHVMNEKDQTD